MSRTLRVLAALLLPLLPLTPSAGCARRVAAADGRLERACLRDGWQRIDLRVEGRDRRVLWRGPREAWRNGAILVLHGGGGQADHFCAGGRLVQPQIAFARLALERGFALFALDAARDAVTDAQGRACGKRFDFSVLERGNVDLPYIERVMREVVPARRPPGSSPELFVAGLSTGGYMTTRAAAELGGGISAFAPISAGDPFGTDAICDASLSRRKSAKGILVDRETLEEIVKDGACAADAIDRESRWPAANGRRPPYRQFHHAADGIVDLSCMRKATAMLERNGFRGDAPFVVPARGGKDPFQHLWLHDYNAPLLDFFAAHVTSPSRPSR